MKVLGSLSRWMGYVSAAVIIILMLLVTFNVCGRYLSSWFTWASPITGATELAKLSMIVIVFPALAWAAIEGKHIKVDLIVERLPSRFQAISDSITLLISLGIYSIIIWQSFLESTVMDDVSSIIKVPYQPFYWAMTVGWAVFCLSILALMIKRIAEAVRR